MPTGGGPGAFGGRPGAGPGGFGGGRPSFTPNGNGTFTPPPNFNGNGNGTFTPPPNFNGNGTPPNFNGAGGAGAVPNDNSAIIERGTRGMYGADDFDESWSTERVQRPDLRLPGQGGGAAEQRRALTVAPRDVVDVVNISSRPHSCHSRGSQQTPSLRGDPEWVRARLLLVEDEENLRSMLESALRHHEFEVDSVSNGREALEALDPLSQDLLLLDVMLPDLDGFEVCRRLRARGVKMPIVFLTAHATRSRRRCAA